MTQLQNTLNSYGPPMLNESILRKRLLILYPNHKTSIFLISELVEEYKRFWRMIVNYPHRRVVATGPVMAVQRAHQLNSEEYFWDCMTYFNRFKTRKDLAWHGSEDYTGTHDTYVVYKDLFKEEPHVAWVAMTSLILVKKEPLKIVR